MSPTGKCIKTTVSTTISVSFHNQYFGINSSDVCKFNFSNFLCCTQTQSTYFNAQSHLP